MSNLEDKVAVVLGASAEGGIGWGVAQALADAGAKVVVAARSYGKLKALAQRIDGLAIACDAGNEDDVKALARAALEKYGRIDIAVNSAGLPVASPIADVSAEQLQEGVRVNYFGNAWFVKYMAEAIGSDGSIVIISSMSSTHPVQPMFAYAAAKAAADCMVRYAAIEYGPRRIRVNSVLPGCVRSDMSRSVFETPGFEQTYANEIPLGRIGEPGDIANAVVWLAGPSYVTGLNLQVNGGNQLTRFPRPHEFSDGGERYGSYKA